MLFSQPQTSVAKYLEPKARFKEIELGDANTLHDMDSGNRGVLVDSNWEDGDIYKLFKVNLRDLESRGIITSPQAMKILNSMDNFLEGYTKAIRDWVDVSGSVVLRLIIFLNKPTIMKSFFRHFVKTQTMIYVVIFFGSRFCALALRILVVEKKLQ